MYRLRIKRYLVNIFVIAGVVVTTCFWCELTRPSSSPEIINLPPLNVSVVERKSSSSSDRSLPLIFIGGMPRSGTTLIRAMLDAHPDVRCGEETRVIPRVLALHDQWRKPSEQHRLQAAGLTNELLSSAVAAFILEVIVKHRESAPRLCNKDPFNLKSALHLSEMFPNAKFLLMIRDGRAVVHSIMSREIKIRGIDTSNFRSCLEKWNEATKSMYDQCLKVGAGRCMPVFYEQLVLHPQQVMRDVLTFLIVRWDDSVLHHERQINKPGGISLSAAERSTDQVVKPINLEALGRWADSVPADVRHDMHEIAPMLDRLGYDADAYPPTYGQPDALVVNNTLRLNQIHVDVQVEERQNDDDNDDDDADDYRFGN